VKIMRISSALLTAAMILSGIVVIEANPAGAQTYSRGYDNGYQNGYQQPAYQGGGYRPANVVVYGGDPVGYQPVPRYGYGSEPVAAPVYEAPVYQSQAYQQPVYEAPRYAAPTYARPTYVTQSYVTPAEPCNERGW
jgi:hypothetical protein